MTTTPLSDGQLVDHIVAAVSHGLRFAEAAPDSVLPETVNAVLAVVLPELDQLRAGRTRRYRAAWLNARNRAAGYQQRYQYERKLCDSADIRATRAIRGQLAAERKLEDALTELDRLGAEIEVLDGVRCTEGEHLRKAVADAIRDKWAAEASGPDADMAADAVMDVWDALPVDPGRAELAAELERVRAELAALRRIVAVHITASAVVGDKADAGSAAVSLQEQLDIHGIDLRAEYAALDAPSASPSA